jgi:hypothetical protein
MATTKATEEARKWIDDVRSRVPPRTNRAGFDGPTEAMATWVAEAMTAIEATLPRGHSVVRQAQSAIDAVEAIRIGKRDGTGVHRYSGALDSFVGAFETLARLVLDGRLGTLVDAARAETEVEVLEQARTLASGGYLAAGAVLAGGALETHLRRLCERNQLTWKGDGSIAAYDAAIAQARNAGTAVVYAKADGGQVVAWGQVRNEAAHAPGSFARTEAEVRAMLDGVTGFIARVQ